MAIVERNGMKVYEPTIEADSMITVKGEEFVKFWIDAQCKRGRFILAGGAYDYDGFAKVVSTNSHTKPSTYAELVTFVGTFGPAEGKRWANEMPAWFDININKSGGYGQTEQIWD